MSALPKLPNLDRGRPAAAETLDLRLSVKLSLLTALQIFFSFLIQWYVVARLGAGIQTDALSAGYTLPQVVSMLAVEPLGFVLVPLLSVQSEQDHRRSCWEVSLSVAGFFGVLCAVLFVVTPFVIPFIVPGLPAAGKALAASLSRIQALAVFGFAMTTTLMCMWQARNRFVWPAVAMLLPYILGLTLLVWKLPVYGIHLAAWVQVLTAIGPSLLLVAILGRPQRAHISWDFFAIGYRRLRPLVLGAAYYKTGTIVDRFLASFLPPGSIVILDLVQRTYGAVERIINQGLVTPMVPQLSRLAGQRAWRQFRDVHRRRVLHMALINAGMFLVLVATWFKWDQLVALVPARSFGHLTPAAISTIATVFVFMSGRLLFSNLGHALTTAFYAQGDTTKPAKIAAFAYTLGVGAKVGGFWIAGIKGIALALSFTSFMNCVLLVVFLKPGIFGWKHAEDGHPIDATRPLQVGHSE